MANALYAKGKQNLLDKKFDLNTDDIRLLGTDHGADTPNVATDDALDDISAGTVMAAQQLDTPTITDGTFDADNEVYTAVSGATVESLTGYLHTGTPATSFLLWYVDTGTNLPFTPNGGDVTVAFHASGIFSL